jgi:hypothetical protein
MAWRLPFIATAGRTSNAHSTRTHAKDGETHHFECFLRSQEVEHGLEVLLDVGATRAHTPTVVATVTAHVTVAATVIVSIVAGTRAKSLVGRKYQCGTLPSEVTLTETAKKEEDTRCSPR